MCYSQWNGRLLAEALPEVGKDQVWRVLRRHDICLERRRSWCIGADAEFGAKAADVVGLYLNPPEKALVLAVDEKPWIQGWSERTDIYDYRTARPSTDSATARSVMAPARYLRHWKSGSGSQFDPLPEITTGLVKTAHYNRRRRREFLDFMNEIVAQLPGREIHVVLDNLNPHRPKEDRWLKRHPNVRFHLTPTYSSWLNQVEVWFSILGRQALRCASFTSPSQLRQAIDDFVRAYNEKAAPFKWKKAVVLFSPERSMLTYASRY
jgi:transposase